MSGTSQADYMRRGGSLANVLEQKYESGELQRETPYARYPHMCYVSRGVQTIERRTDVVKGRDVEPFIWTETKEMFDEVIVNSEAEEERVLAGGQSEAQLEAQRQDLIAQCKARSIQVDVTWGIVRLQRELGSAPTNETVDALRLKVADLQEKADLRQRIAALEAQLAAQPALTPQPMPASGGVSGSSLHFQPVDELAALQAELESMGIVIDKRWGIARLRVEMNAARNPDGA